MSPSATEREGAPSLRDAIRQLRIELQIVNDAVAAAAGLNPRDLDVLDVIDREGPCTPSHLARRTGCRRATLTGVLARLEDQGWIARDDNPADRRSAHLRSTSRFDELRRLYRPMTDGAETLIEALDPGSRRIVEQVLTDVIVMIREAGFASMAAGGPRRSIGVL